MIEMKVILVEPLGSRQAISVDPAVAKELQDKDRLIESLRQQLVERDKIISSFQSQLQYVQGVADDELMKAIHENFNATLQNLRGLEAKLLDCLDQLHQFKLLKIEPTDESCKCCQK